MYEFDDKLKRKLSGRKKVNWPKITKRSVMIGLIGLALWFLFSFDMIVQQIV